MNYVTYGYPHHYYHHHHHHHPYYTHVPMHYWNYWGYNYPHMGREIREFNDQGKRPFVININEATKQNNTFRSAIWTGPYLQVTLMSLQPGEDIGLEMHPDVDQFLRVEQGDGIVQMGKNKNQLDFVRQITDDSAIIIPAGYWHNLTNSGNIPLKLYSIYAPPNHPFGTVHKTKADAMEAEHEH